MVFSLAEQQAAAEKKARLTGKQFFLSQEAEVCCSELLSQRLSLAQKQQATSDAYPHFYLATLLADLCCLQHTGAVW